jgi:hypothetical protein
MAMKQPLNLQRVWRFSVMYVDEEFFVGRKTTAAGAASLSEFATEVVKPSSVSVGPEEGNRYRTETADINQNFCSPDKHVFPIFGSHVTQNCG